MFYFCTYFDSNYLIKGLALYRSLVRHAKPFHLWVLCFDDITFESLQKLNLPEIELISLKDFEKGDEELLKVKANRSRIEYYFTCTPSLPLYILKNYPEVDLITYLDADLFFFSDIFSLYQKLQDGSVFIVEHRFPERLRYLTELYGIYNVGFLSFRRDNAGLECLTWWREKCLKKCKDSAEDENYADQKYLDDWSTRFSGVKVLSYKGIGLAPWNLENYHITLEKGYIFVDAQPLLFFHFAGLRQVKKWLYRPGLTKFNDSLKKPIYKHIYRLYLREIREIERWLSFLNNPCIRLGTIRHNKQQIAERGNIFRRTRRMIREWIDEMKEILRWELYVMIAGRVW